MIKYFDLKTDRGYDISVKQSGVEENVKNVVIGVHGFTGSKESDNISSLSSELEEKGDSIIFSGDFPMHGQSNAEKGKLTVKNCLTDLGDIVKYAKEKYPNANFFLFANSFGSYISFLYLSQHDDCFKAAILRAPAINMKRVLYEKIFPDKNLTVKDFLENGMYASKKTIYIDKKFIDELEEKDVFKIFRNQYKTPVFIYQGTADILMTPEEVSSFVNQNMGNMKLEFIEGACHSMKGDSAKYVIDQTLNIIKSFEKNKVSNGLNNRKSF